MITDHADDVSGHPGGIVGRQSRNGITEGFVARNEERVPPAVRVAGALVGLQGLAGLGFVVAVLLGSAKLSYRLGTAGYFVLITAGVIAVAVGLLRGARWSRTPAVVLELLLIGVAWYALGGGQRPEIGVPVGVYCVVVIVLLLLKPSRQWAVDDRSVDEGSPGGSDKPDE